MQSAPVKYGIRLGCRFGTAHDFTQIKDTPNFKVDKCKICSKREKWNKGYRRRVDNVRYLKSHVRNYAQPGGSTRRVYEKIYRPENCIITINLCQ